MSCREKHGGRVAREDVVGEWWIKSQKPEVSLGF